MKVLRLAFLFFAATALIAAPRCSHAASVDVSLNVFPTNLAIPNGGGTWRVVAKTDSLHGISAINMYVTGVNIPGMAMEPDIGAILNGGNPFAGVIGIAVNMLYGQDTSNPPTVVVGVGTPAKSDGLDPLGSAFWNGATRIMSGTYSSTVPAFTVAGANTSDANTLSTSTPPFNASLDADSTFVVRVQVPEPATSVAALSALVGLRAVRRRK